MADKPTDRPDMSDEEIREVFELLQLPTTPKAFPPASEQPSAPVVFFPVSGHSPPLKTP